MNKKIQKQLKILSEVPDEVKKQEFLTNLDYQKESKLSFIISQIQYINLSFWLCSILVFLTIIMSVIFSENDINKISNVSSLLPFLVIISTKEIHKSNSYNMSELEMSCRYNLIKITLVRIIIISVFYSIILFILLFVVKLNVEIDFVGYIVYLLLPFVTCSYITLLILNNTAHNQSINITTGFNIFIVGINLIFSNTLIVNNNQKINIILFILLGIMAMLIIKELRKFIKNMEEVVCNLSLNN